jgi:hypothetical protein
MTLVAVYRMASDGVKEYLIVNGFGMGKWTSLFGVNCLADLDMNIQYVTNMYKTHKDSHIETYKLSLISNK